MEFTAEQLEVMEGIAVFIKSRGIDISNATHSDMDAIMRDWLVMGLKFSMHVQNMERAEIRSLMKRTISFYEAHQTNNNQI